jgi:hypothetical protein
LSQTGNSRHREAACPLAFDYTATKWEKQGFFSYKTLENFETNG